MKLFLIVAILLIACNSSQNKKEAIVERQKLINAEIELIERKIDTLYHSRNEGENIDSALLRMRALALPFKTRRNLLNKEYDSLEFELKKY